MKKTKKLISIGGCLLLAMANSLVGGNAQSHYAPLVDSIRNASTEVAAVATLVPPMGGPGITAVLTFNDNGTPLRVTGTAYNLDPNKHYHTLIYDRNSMPGGPAACVPSVRPPVGGLSFDQMQVGSWQPIGASVRTLSATRQGVGVFGVLVVRF